MQDASQLATAHYPETLDRIFVCPFRFLKVCLTLTILQIIGAPSFFPTVWGWIKKWFDPITTSKIFILSPNQVLPTLSSFIDIADIPKKYGGQLDFECGKMPMLDQQVRDCLSIAPGSDTEKLFLTAPVRWRGADEDGEMTAVGVGSIEGKQRKEVVATLHSLAVRVATSSSRRTQSYRADPPTEGAPADRPPTYHNREQQAALPTHPLSKGQPVLDNNSRPSSKQSQLSQQALPNPSRPTSIQPAPAANLSTASIHDQPIHPSGTLQYPLQQNGGPPEKISLPPPPTNIERTKTEYMTPASDAAEILKKFDLS